jgi:hypothetical protein
VEDGQEKDAQNRELIDLSKQQDGENKQLLELSKQNLTLTEEFRAYTARERQDGTVPGSR